MRGGLRKNAYLLLYPLMGLSLKELTRTINSAPKKMKPVYRTFLKHVSESEPVQIGGDLNHYLTKCSCNEPLSMLHFRGIQYKCYMTVCKKCDQLVVKPESPKSCSYCRERVECLSWKKLKPIHSLPEDDL